MHDPIWQTALEQLFRTQRYIRGQSKHAHFATHAEAYAWGVDPIRAVRYLSQQVAVDTIGPEPPSPFGWWWFEEPLLVAANNLTLDAILFGRSGDITALVPVSLGHTSVSEWMGTGYVVGKSIKTLYFERPHPTEADRLFALALARFFTAGCLWLNDRVTLSHIERHARKRMARTYQTDVPATVKVVQLRRANTPDPPAEHRLSAAEFSRRWIVREHIRNQPYKDGHRPKLIEAYVKGPADKPLHVPSHTVYSVTR